MRNVRLSLAAADLFSVIPALHRKKQTNENLPLKYFDRASFYLNTIADA